MIMARHARDELTFRTPHLLLAVVLRDRSGGGVRHCLTLQQELELAAKSIGVMGSQMREVVWAFSKAFDPLVKAFAPLIRKQEF